MRFSLFLIIKLFPLLLSSQNLSETDIKELAEHTNNNIQGVDIGNGIIGRKCISFGRTLIYYYDVPDYWEVHKNIKNELISNLKISGAAKDFFKFDIDIVYYYYKDNSLIKKVSITSDELSIYSAELGDYISIVEHPKSKKVNMKLKAPKGWEVKEGVMPNIVKKFTMGDNIYMILIKENVTFYSRNESINLLSDNQFVNELVEESCTFLNDYEIIDTSIVTIGTYPTLTFKTKGNIERSGNTIPIIMRVWIVLYEDKFVYLQTSSKYNAEFRALEKLYFSITNSVIFPDQYN